MRKATSILALTIVTSLVSVPVADGVSSKTQPVRAKAKTIAHKCPKTLKGIKENRNTTWHYQRQLGMAASSVSAFPLSMIKSCKYASWINRLWIARAKTLHREWNSLSDPERAIRHVFGRYAEQALAVARCESGLSIYATNGQYLGLFQMGNYARSTYGHSYTALGQARSAFAYFAQSGYDWSPWQCKPWGLGW